MTMDMPIMISSFMGADTRYMRVAFIAHILMLGCFQGTVHVLFAQEYVYLGSAS